MVHFLSTAIPFLVLSGGFFHQEGLGRQVIAPTQYRLPSKVRKTGKSNYL